ncbi:MAG: protein BatD [Desulfobacterales bacterium]|nr:protein BatD [Desulfobacterales bacterium]
MKNLMLHKKYSKMIIKEREWQYFLVATLGFIFLIFIHGNAGAEQLRADAAVERDNVFLGEPFIFQIQVKGSEKPEKPSLKGISGFEVKFQGGQQNSSSSVTIVNGRVTQSVKKGYFFSFQLTPKHTGRLTIPAINVKADGRVVRTRPIAINVQKPVSTDDFKLRLDVSKTECYVGEPVILTFTWYIGKDVRGFSFTLPLLENKDIFHFADRDVDTSSGKKFYRIPLGDGQVIGEKGKGRYKGKEYATITFQKILIPKRAGTITIEPARVVCEALSGYSSRSRSFGNDFFSDDFFGRGRRGRYRKVVVPSNSLKLAISDLPLEGRPEGFDGHVGEYRIRASATPTSVSVGDPITLTITLSGPEYLDHISLPPLGEQKALTGNFKIPEERAVGEISGRSKVFTQTIRALTPDLPHIPSIGLSYFNTRSKRYEITGTEPIPLEVKTARVVTALDAEGISPGSSARTQVETWVRGIAYNYEDLSVIENQRFRPLSWLKSPLWMFLIILPPLIYLFLVSGTVIIRKRNADPLAIQARKAYGTLTHDLKEAEKSDSEQKACELILDGIRKYLGHKLRITGGAITFEDVRTLLLEKGINEDDLLRLKDLFEKCEAGRYAGTSGLSDISTLVSLSVNLAKEFEKRLR